MGRAWGSWAVPWGTASGAFDGSSCAMRMGSYETIKEILLDSNGVGAAFPLPQGALIALSSAPSEAIVIGAIAQGIAGWCTNPVDVLKTRVQAAAVLLAKDGGGIGGGVRDVLRDVLREGGLRSLMRGAMMRTAFICPQG